MAEVKKQRFMALTGNGAAVEALRQIDPHVFAMFPITPSTQIPEWMEKLISEGNVRTRMIRAESEHSAISAAHGAALTGARVVDASASQGIALKHEILYITAANRLPVLMLVANRALSGPINIHADHSDTMGSRDAGWIHIYAENVQEVYDTTVQAYRIAEHSDVLLPIIVGFDGFTVSHALSLVNLIDDADVKDFIGTPHPPYSILNTDTPMTFGAFALQDYYMEYRYQMREAMNNALSVIEDVGREYGEKFGRTYGPIDPYFVDDAEVVLVVIGSTAATIKDVVDILRAEGKKVGMLRVRSYRPFPTKQIRNALKNAKIVAVLDRADSPGTPNGPLFADVSMSMLNMLNPPWVTGAIYGLGGRELLEDQIREYYEAFHVRWTEYPEPGTYVGLRE